MGVKNVCKCSNPPGGEVECEPHQLAICGIWRGKEVRACIDPPKSQETKILAIWALRQVTFDESRALDDEGVASLKAGEYQGKNGFVRFKLPPVLEKELKNW